MKRALVQILSLLLLLSCIAGCGAQTEAPSSETTESPQTQSIAPESNEPEEEDSIYPLSDTLIELTAWGNTSAEWVPITDREVYTYLEELTNVHIETVDISQDQALQQFNILLAAEDLPNLVPFTYFYSSSIDEAIENEYIIDMYDLSLEYAPNFWACVEANGLEKDVLTENGALAVMPGIYDNGSIIDYGLGIRGDWLEELGLEEPETYDDYYNVLTAFKTAYDCAPLELATCGVGKYNTMCAGFDIACYFKTAGASAWEDYPFYRIDNQVYCGLTQDAFLDYLTLMNQWYSEGLINLDSMTTWGDNARGGMYQDGILANEVGVWGTFVPNNDLYPSMSDDENFRVIPAMDPVQNPGDWTHLGYQPGIEGASISIIYRGFSVSSKCAYPEIAIQWLDYAYSEEGAMFSNWGIEGETYELDANGDPVYTDFVLANPDGMSTSTALSYFKLGLPFQGYSMSTDAGLALYGESGLDFAENYNRNKDSAYNLPNAMILTADESIDFSAYWADICTYAAENMVKFIISERPLDEFDDFVSTLESMGINEMVAMAQACLDRYNG